MKVKKCRARGMSAAHRTGTETCRKAQACLLNVDEDLDVVHVCACFEQTQNSFFSILSFSALY